MNAFVMPTRCGYYVYARDEKRPRGRQTHDERTFSDKQVDVARAYRDELVAKFPGEHVTFTQCIY